MIKRVIFASLFMVLAALLQSTVLSRLRLYALPDLALCILIFTAYVNGSMTGQLNGFISGFFIDFISAAPLGLNAFIRTLVGALSGLLKGTFFLDPFFLPMILCALATILKALLYFLLNIVLGDTVPSYSLFEGKFWMELGLNTILAPFLFGLLKLASSLLVGEGDKT